MLLTPEELLAGGALTHRIEIPAELLPGGEDDKAPRQVSLKPLSVRDLQRIDKAARNDESLSAALMIK